MGVVPDVPSLETVFVLELNAHSTHPMRLASPMVGDTYVAPSPEAFHGGATVTKMGPPLSPLQAPP